MAQAAGLSFRKGNGINMLAGYRVILFKLQRQYMLLHFKGLFINMCVNHCLLIVIFYSNFYSNKYAKILIKHFYL